MIVLKSIGAGREKKRKDILIHAHAVSFLAPRYFRAVVHVLHRP